MNPSVVYGRLTGPAPRGRASCSPRTPRRSTSPGGSCDRGPKEVGDGQGELARRVAPIQVLTGQLDEAARAEELAPARPAAKTIADPPAELAAAQTRCRHPCEASAPPPAPEREHLVLYDI